MSEKELKSFFKGYAKEQEKHIGRDKAKFKYDDNGNLVDKFDNVITLKSYRAVTANELDEMEKQRREYIAAAEGAYEDAIQLLRQLIDDGASDVDILIQNEAVKVADEALQKAKYVDIDINYGDNYEIRQLLFENRYEKRKFENIRLPSYYPFDIAELYVREGEPEVKQEAAPASASAPTFKRKPKIILFELPSDLAGFLTLQFPSMITIGDYTYDNAYQAVMGQMAQLYGDDEHFAEIMGAESPDAITYGPEQAGKEPEEWNAQYEATLMDVLTKKFEQNPELANQLYSTRGYKLGAIIAGDNIFGIGQANGTPESKNMEFWGQNKLGKILENIRTTIVNTRKAEQAALAEQVAVAPAVEQVAPTAEAAAPAAEQVAPIVEQVAPAVEQVAPAVEQVAPAAKPKRVLRFVPQTTN
jgi:ribA/ribD-fused uncharacterized protein